jgi:hypothetical protein
MRFSIRQFVSLSFAAVLASAVLVAGCAAHVRVYDPYYHDYHAWNDHETVYYGQWEHDTHRDHVEFNARSDGDKKAYWDWRHSH